MPEFDGNIRCKGRFRGDSVSSKCKPCQHAILDVWGGAEKELSRLVRETDLGGPLGLVATQGWFAPADLVKMYPELASFRGLLQANLTNELFKRPISFGEYCYVFAKETKEQGRDWDFSFCRMFYAYHGFIVS